MDIESDSGLRLHHIGIVVPAIDERTSFYKDGFQYHEKTRVIHDKAQTAYVQFLEIPGADHYLELVAPDNETSMLSNASRRTPGLHHLCYSCENAAKAIERLRELGCFIVREPVPAVAFDGRLIAWLMTPDRLLIELVERGPAGSL